MVFDSECYSKMRRVPSTFRQHVTRARALSEVRPVPRRGLCREEAAMYVGIGPGKFDQLVDDGRMPRSLRIDGRKVWDIRELDLAFDALPRDDGGSNSWGDV
jgi:hypothetical protein